MAAGASAAASIEALIPAAVLRGLSDRSFEKRRSAAQEVERVVRGLASSGQDAAVRRLLTILATDFAGSVLGNTRKGGLLALASAALALGAGTAEHLDVIVPAVLKSFGDPDSRLRYYACESLFNITKACRGAMLRYFGDVFVGVCKLVADTDLETKNGAHLLDRLLKEIVMESEALDVERFVPLLRSHMAIVNPYVRQLLVGWITALDTAPGVHMLDHLSELLEGLFSMLSDGNREIRQQAYAALSTFLDQIGKISAADFESRVAFRPMVDTLIAQTGRERDKFNRVTAIEWLTQFVLVGQHKLCPVYDKLIATVLRCLSDPEAEIVSEATKTNQELLQLLREGPRGRDFDAVVPSIITIVVLESRAKDKTTRAAGLRWVALLLVIAPGSIFTHVDSVLHALLANLLDTDDADVLRMNLEVIARLSVHDLTFLRTRLLSDLVRLFADNRPLLESKGAFILRRLCLLLDARIIYTALARILADQPNREFASLCVELLNLILLTALELTDLRDCIRGCCAPVLMPTPTAAAAPAPASEATALVPAAAAVDGSGGGSPDSSGGSGGGAEVFLELYRTWCINPVATFALCLLAQAYELAARVVTRFAETTVSVGVLMQCDKFVQLLETPIFLTTRLHLTQPERVDHPHLLRALYGLLMLLPQGVAFATLRERLASVSSLNIALTNAALSLRVFPGTVPDYATPTATSAVGSAVIESPLSSVAATALMPAPPSSSLAYPPLPSLAASAAAAGARASPIAIDTAFQLFVEAQARYRAALAADLRSRSVLVRFQMQQQQQAAAGVSTHAGAAGHHPHGSSLAAAATSPAASSRASSGRSSAAATRPAAGVTLGGLSVAPSTRPADGIAVAAIIPADDVAVAGGDGDGDGEADDVLGLSIPPTLAAGGAGGGVGAAVGGITGGSIRGVRGAGAPSLRDELRGAASGALRGELAPVVERSGGGSAAFGGDARGRRGSGSDDEPDDDDEGEDVAGAR